MPVFNYQATDHQASRVSGVLEAPSARSAGRLLLAKGIRPSSVREASRQQISSKSKWLIHSLIHPLLALTEREQLLEALENLLTLLQSGVSLEFAWASLIPTASAAGLRRQSPLQAMICKIRDSVAQGRALSLALADCPLHFDAVDVALIRAGEDAGELTMALERLIARKRLSSNLASTIAAAIAYPLFLLVMGCGVVIFLAGWVIPNLNAMLIAGGGTVPLLTRMLQHLAWFLSVGLLPTVLLAGVGIGVLLKRSAMMRTRVAEIVLRLPVIGSMWMNWQLSQFCLVLRTLLSSGVQLPQALSLSAEATGGPIAVAAKRLRERVIEGSELTPSAEDQTSVIPDWLWRALEVGQDSGELPQVLERVGKRSEAAALRSASRLGTVVFSDRPFRTALPARGHFAGREHHPFPNRLFVRANLVGQCAARCL